MRRSAMGGSGISIIRRVKIRQRCMTLQRFYIILYMEFTFLCYFESVALFAQICSIIGNETCLLYTSVRGDLSRNTEGSGLGLSIAKSLTEMMKGRFEVTLEGDSFQAKLQFPLAEVPEL